ncbi:glycerophosphodiester phosphodiesterase family protein [Niveispirillum sp. BGYR6]|uniref:glycerophosphodiester phosphodiesterase family protein n=1 Tax=Niveispirillum sp. BGYR6 TaxID=2971249 RepID=UPI0022B96381|nr:glycerophosphodiester phosphodiesterase family protein [Niveispirillum sp. BGYR6]MDG5494817.1 glycerophosphodiester phosphodiesterase family protein [Niveispirillum sp. BGYR6]
MRAFALTLLISLVLGSGLPAKAENNATKIANKINKSPADIIVIAHRGCHNPIPSLKLAGTAPENSLETLERCVALGVDVMETDVRRTKDGYLVMIHDDSIDRTTNGQGKVSALTLDQIRQFRLRADEGGEKAPLTDAQVPTLEEMLLRGQGRIIFNLDVKDAIYAEVVATVIRLGVADRVLVKNVAGAGSPPLSGIEPYRQVPFVPILASADRAGSDLVAVARHQGQADRLPVAYEAPYMDFRYLPDLAAEAKRQGVRLWVNSLFDGFIAGLGSDEMATRDPDGVWGRMIGAGVSMIQTDYPDALIAYLRHRQVGAVKR